MVKTAASEEHAHRELTGQGARNTAKKAYVGAAYLDMVNTGTRLNSYNQATTTHMANDTPTFMATMTR